MVKLLALVAFILVFWWLAFAEKDNHLELGANSDINVTPQQIQLIKDIGEWEFLSVSNEELVDTVRKGLFSDDHLVRIYYGTLRLGIDLSKAKKGWIKTQGDSVMVTLPKIGLLDKDFIDEARTKSFYESGSWTARDREALYQKARRLMLARCMTPANQKVAQENAEAQFQKMLKALGYQNIIIKFEE
jgi:hypothetical protein